MRLRFRGYGSASIFTLAVWLLCALNVLAEPGDKTPQGATRTYYIAAEEIEWDYAPNGKDMMMSAAFDPYARVFTAPAADRIGCTYRKAVFREYTDDTFRTLKPRPPEQAHMGLLGPVIRAEVGDTIKVVFRNNASFAFSLHPHGVAYTRDSEGAMYADGMEHPEANGLVPPGKTHTYTWFAREQAGPGPQDGSSVVWIYHSHNFEPKDVNAGLIGPIVITRRGMGRADASPKDVDHEFFSLFMIVDENQSQYFGQNIKAHIAEPSKLDRAEVVPADPDGNGDLPLGHGFAMSNLKFTINGYLFGNGPMMTMRKGDHVRWYVMTMGNGFNFHTPHWHGNLVSVRGQYMDVIPTIGPAQFVTADMTPDMAGTWMFHCHVDDHMKGGMQTMYRVLDSDAPKPGLASSGKAEASQP
ncbi:MAG: multicopper oxidase domain-containing protein [Candidatus Sulfotelmatobacter sp.]